MRILHTSDWHLGRNLEGRSRIPEQKEFIDELLMITERENINLILVAGDVFDTYNPSAEAEQLFYEALERLSKNGSRAVVVIAGNHDSPDRLHAANPLAQKHGIFLIGYPGEQLMVEALSLSDRMEVAATADYSSAVGNKVTKVAGGPGWLELAIPGSDQNTVVAYLPYPSEQRLNEILSESLEDYDMQKAYSERVYQAFEQGALNYREDTVNLAVSHIFVLGGRGSDSERDIQLGGAYVVEPAKIPGKADYVALGHLHRPQLVGGSPAPCRFSGSPLAYSFSESDQQKEVVLVEVVRGVETVIRPIKLTCGKPMRFLRFGNYQDAYDWCSGAENQHAWVDMEIVSSEPLTGAGVAELRRLHQGVINIRVILPGVKVDDEEKHRISELSLEEKFRRFVVRETGNEAEAELVKLFLQVLEGSDSHETD